MKRLRKWVKVVAFFILLILLFIIVKGFLTRSYKVIEKGKNYTCYGSIILEVCYGEDYDVK